MRPESRIFFIDGGLISLTVKKIRLSIHIFTISEGLQARDSTGVVIHDIMKGTASLSVISITQKVHVDSILHGTTFLGKATRARDKYIVLSGFISGDEIGVFIGENLAKTHISEYKYKLSDYNSYKNIA